MMKDKILNFLRGIVMGIADLFPGISGGTIALILGIYKEFITNLSNLGNLIRRGKTKPDFGFLTPLFLGIITAIFLGSKITSYLIQTHPIIVMSFFFGFLLMSIKIPFRMVKKWETSSIIGLILGTLFAGIFSLNSTLSIPHNGFYFLVSGFVAISFMLLPGVSGSSSLLILGTYPAIIAAIGNLNFSILLWVAIGVGLGVLTMTKLLHLAMEKKPNMTFAILTGLLIGSLVRVWPARSLPGFGEGVPVISLEILSFGVLLSVVLGIGLITGIEMIGRRLKK